MKGRNSIISLCTATMFLFSGCGTANKQTESKIEFKGYPLSSNTEITYWLPLNSGVSSIYANFAETEFAKTLAERTGINVKYVHPAAGQEEASLSLLIASNQFPDIMEFSWLTYNGGPKKNLSEKIIKPLNDIINDYAPNFSNYLKNNPDIDKMIKTDDGTYYVFPFIRGDKSLLISVGGMIRQDWLSELNLSVPETVMELENVLTEFKNKKGATAPASFMSSNMNIFLGNFGSTSDFYIDNGVVKYGPLEPNYRIAAETLNRWFDNGLLDPNFVSLDKAALDSNILMGKSGYTVGSGGGNLGTWLDNMKDNNEPFEMVGMPFTAIESGRGVEYYNIETNYPGYGSVAISDASKNVELAARYLDYAYGEEGEMFYNFGTEGLSYEMKEGVPTYTDEIYNNPDSLTISQAMGKYFRASMSGPFIQSKDYITQFYFRPQQRATLDAWLKNYDAIYDKKFPSATLTEAETSEYTSIMNEITKYTATSQTNFIVGTTSMEKYDEFTAKLKSLNIDRAIAIQQAAYDRFKKR